jgi:hypothetical protein
VETGRYGDKIGSPHLRTCKFCSTGDKNVLELLAQLLTAELIIENETHFLSDCPYYDDLRKKLSPEMKRTLETPRSYGALFDPNLLSES